MPPWRGIVVSRTGRHHMALTRDIERPDAGTRAATEERHTGFIRRFRSHRRMFNLGLYRAPYGPRTPASPTEIGRWPTAASPLVTQEQSKVPETGESTTNGSLHRR